MPQITFYDEEIAELRDLIIWAISEGYLTNEITKQLIYKSNIDKNIIDYLDKNCNIGTKISK
ncbi:hypothetical protein [Clostridium beijerinckii]|uniref:hypothetical protein n=1 Tax=Clostridium beijerinckii TaxID=1520 RepID=UPI00156EB985|nr:hypothetical protein [Clostridium beijerinckii]NRT69995.1 hypothetical protein [Clostridium beijerinckii]NRT70046.1 hypothetical protein [Clostridium beijerinckii]